jgi:putative sterol carrier protein
MSEIARIFERLARIYPRGGVSRPLSYYFSLGDEEKWTVLLTPEKCEVRRGKPGTDADCFVKASAELFLDVWNGRYTPSARDFLTGAIKSNNPLMIRDFVAAFQKD